MREVKIRIILIISYHSLIKLFLVCVPLHRILSIYSNFFYFSQKRENTKHKNTNFVNPAFYHNSKYD